MGKKIESCYFLVMTILLLVTPLYLITFMSEQNSRSDANRPTRKVVPQNSGGIQATEVKTPKDQILKVGVEKVTPDEAEQKTLLTNSDEETVLGDDSGSMPTELVSPLVAVQHPVTAPSVTALPVTPPPENGAGQPLETLKRVSSRAVVLTQDLFRKGKDRYDTLSPKTRRYVLVGGVAAVVVAGGLLVFAVAGGRKDSPSTSVPDRAVSAPSDQAVPQEVTPSEVPAQSTPSPVTTQPAPVAPGNYVFATVIQAQK